MWLPSNIILNEGAEFRAYETGTDEVVARLRAIDPEPGSAILLTGTELVSAASVYLVGHGCRVPILSSNLCLVDPAAVCRQPGQRALPGDQTGGTIGRPGPAPSVKLTSP